MIHPTHIGAIVRMVLKGLKTKYSQELDSKEPFFKFLDPYVELWILGYLFVFIFIGTFIFFKFII